MNKFQLRILIVQREKNGGEKFIPNHLKPSRGLCSTEAFPLTRFTPASKLRILQQNDLINQAPPECHSYTDKKEVCFNEA